MFADTLIVDISICCISWDGLTMWTYGKVFRSLQPLKSTPLAFSPFIFMFGPQKQVFLRIGLPGLSACTGNDNDLLKIDRGIFSAVHRFASLGLCFH